MNHLIVFLLLVASAYGTEVPKELYDKVIVFQNPGSSFTCSKDRAVEVLWSLADAFNTSAKEIPNMVINCTDDKNWKTLFAKQKDSIVILSVSVGNSSYSCFEIWLGRKPEGDDYARAFLTVFRDCFHWEDKNMIERGLKLARQRYNSTLDVSEVQKNPCAR